MKQFVKKTILKTKYKEWTEHWVVILVGFMYSIIITLPILEHYNIIFTNNIITDFFLVIGVITTTIIIGYIFSYIIYLIVETKTIYVEDKK